MTKSLILKKIVVAAAAIASAGIMVASPASATQDTSMAPRKQACTNLGGPAGGYVPLCKTWVWDGNDYDGRWWTDGPSTLPSMSYLERQEDGDRPVTSNFSGTYHDRDKVVFRVCDRRAGCNGWW